MKALLTRSIEILKKHQAWTGAFPAAPYFPPYRYVWLRDGTFVAWALDWVGEREAAGAFYSFMSRTILKHSYKIERALKRATEGYPLDDATCLHTRYTLKGEEGQEPWGNFQLDGYGTFLWGLAHHLRAGGRGREEYIKVIAEVTRYLCGLWKIPCLDCWEERGDRLHPSTLAAIYGGLKAVLDWLPLNLKEKAQEVLIALPEVVKKEFVVDGHLVKEAYSPEVDGNLLWLAIPYGVLDLEEPVFIATVQKIEEDLRGGGVKRYRGDTFYGGGEWVLLTAWLAWYYRLRGKEEEARELLSWIEAQADEEGQLPEQVPSNLTSEEHYYYWIERWGPIARPLLWSHAMYIAARLPVLVPVCS
ncbi:Glycosyl hydrolases family 15 [Thermanaeromonas toyohensis ToBE]|uniref:Glycosyl hydrolases family 15 n=1 Tax=Thermanaeromonas toyohensis ToBE TaxID=698762 RepID=A0A1W1V590_9FIRM|nr:glycoside hydrolase family 15 protein [Thermanaeromonas toyohensis]SMB88455.1 Glycosyl hydrolases family 15 [Thermanaeromonas toyohensis ToBE]